MKKTILCLVGLLALATTLSAASIDATTNTPLTDVAIDVNVDQSTEGLAVLPETVVPANFDLLLEKPVAIADDPPLVLPCWPNPNCSGGPLPYPGPLPGSWVPELNAITPIV